MIVLTGNKISNSNMILILIKHLYLSSGWVRCIPKNGHRKDMTYLREVSSRAQNYSKLNSQHNLFFWGGGTYMII